MYIRNSIRGWESYFEGWVLSGAKRDLLVVKYEDLKIDTLNEVKRMLDFLRVPFSREDLKDQLLKDFTIFQRNYSKEFEHFTPDQEEYVRQRVESVIALLKTANNQDTLGVEEYLNPTVLGADSWAGPGGPVLPRPPSETANNQDTLGVEEYLNPTVLGADPWAGPGGPVLPRPPSAHS